MSNKNPLTTSRLVREVLHVAVGCIGGVAGGSVLAFFARLVVDATGRGEGAMLLIGTASVIVTGACGAIVGLRQSRRPSPLPLA